MAAATKKKTKTVEIEELKLGRFRAYLLGTTALIMNRFSKKAREELLFPRGELNRAEKASHLKHDPVNEFRESLYRNRDPSEPTFIHYPSGAFSKAMASTATDIPGATKAQMSRLTSAVSVQVNLFGIPKLFMAMVRNSDMNHTPDIRTRAIFPTWACSVEFEFVESLIKHGQAVNLLSAAGRIRGLGDWRPEKGGSCGKFIIVDEKHPDYVRITEEATREPQMAAYKSAEPYDYESEELLAWFREECVRREVFVPSDDMDFEGEDLTAAEIGVLAERANKQSGNGKSSGKKR